MEEWLVFATEKAFLLINAMALVVIVVGTVEAFFSCLRLMFFPAATNHERRSIWLRFARWLVAAA